LSDLDEDFDSDGIPDGVEVNAFRTDPKLASSVPLLDAPAEGIVYAPSFIAARYLQVGCASGATGGRVCNAGRAAGCGTDPANVCHFSDLSAAPPGLFAPDGGAVAVNVPSTALEAIPLSATAVVYLHRQPGGEQVVRVRSDGSTFPVLSAVRSRCPVAGNEAELLACDAAPPRHQWIDPDARFTPLAFDPVLRRAHVLATTSTGLFHYAIGENDVLYLGDVSREQRFPATQASHLRTGGFLLHHQRSGPWLGVSLVDSLLRPVETTQQYVHRPPQHWFRVGLSGYTSESHLLEQSPGTSECGVSNGIFVCDINPPRPPVYRARDFSLELVPVGPALERGEVLMWSPSRVYTFTGAVVPPGGLPISPDDYRAAGWLLWRVTPLGGVVEWMDAARFKAQLTPADLALVEATPLSAIGHIGVSPDGQAICLAEPAAQRVWELRLDATSRELASIALAGAGTACAYDEQSHLVRAGAALELGSGPVTLPSGTTAAALLRAGGRWVVRREGAPLLCVTDEGEVQTTTLSPVAIAPAFGGVAWVDANDGFVSTTEKLCDESAALAGFATGDVPLWSRLYGTFTFRSVRAATGSLAVRPDGMVTLGIATAIVAGSAPHVPALVPLVPFHAFPRYVPLAGAPMPGTEDFRLRELVEAPLSTRPGEVRAMAVIPGADPGRDWGYFPERPGEADTSSPDAGVVDGGPGTPEPTPAPGCGCTSGSATVTLLLGLALLRRRARPWGSPRSPTR
jgi:hypothetical protein